ncbi:MAG: tape measure protein [Phenylobacterium sp.]|uniref:tape measure protein n=1 Tax=Phenylobacterium sp. TaxID=1871053 RepID=UPI00391CBD60
MSELVVRLRLDADAKQWVGTVDQGAGAVERLGQRARKAGGDLRQAEAATQSFEQKTQRASAAVAALAAALGFVGARQLASNLTEAATAAKGFEIGLGAVAGGLSGSKAEMGFVRAEAARLGLDVRKATQEFLGLAGATNGTAMAGQDTREVWLGVAEAGLAMGRSNEQVSRGLMAIQQIASKGVVSMEEIRQQLAEAIPGAVNIAARAMGVSTAELNKMIEQGKLLSTEFLPKFAQQLRTEFGPAIERHLTSDIGRARVELGKLQTALFDLSARGGEAFLGGVVEGISDLNRALTEEETIEALADLGRQLGELAGFGAQALGFLASNAETATIVLGALAGVRVGAMLASAATQAVAAAQGVGLLAAATTALGGPLGIVAALAGGVAVAGLAAYAFSASEAAEEARRLDANTLALDEALAEAERLGLAAGSAIGGMGSESRNAVDPTDTLAGSVGKLADQTFRLAAARKAAAVNHLLAAAATATTDIDEIERRETRRRSTALSMLAAGVGEAGMPADLRAEAQRNLAQDAAAKETEALLAKRREQRDRLLAAAQNAMAAPLEQFKEEIPANALPDDGKGKSKRAGRLASDLEADVVALKAYREALRAGGVALDEWRVKDAGRQAVEKAGLAHKDKLTAAEGALAGRIRQAAEESERLNLANERVARAIGLQRTAELDREALQRRTAAAVAGEQALENLRVTEAGLAAQREIGIETLEQLTGADRAEAEAAIAAAEARERQAIATEKAERVANTVRDIDRQIASERARTAAIQGGARAMADFAKAEAVRLEVERAGKTLTAEQIEQIREKVELLLQLQAANDNADFVRMQQEELELLRMTNREREIEIRAREWAIRLARENNQLSEDELKLRSRILATRDADNEAHARAIGDLREDLRRAYVEGGELGFDQVAEYAKRRLREAVYEALLKQPIDIIINATVGGINGLIGGNGGGGLLGSILGTGLGSLLGSAGAGMALGQAMGLGTGRQGTDLALSLGGSALGTAFAGTMGAGWLGAGIANTALSMGASTAIAGGLGAALSSAAVLGPIAAIAALAIGSLFKDDQRPYARTDIGVQNGQFAITGGQSLDNGPLDKTNQAAQQIVASLNAAADLFKLDLSKLSGNLGSFGYVQGKNTGNLGQGWFGGDGGGFSGAQFTGFQDPEKLAAEVVRATILKAIEAGASDLSEAEKNVVRQAASLEEAATKIAAGRSIMQSIEDAILQLTDPAAFERKKALEAIEASYQALKTQAEELIAAGLISADALQKLDDLKTLQTADALARLGAAAMSTADKLKTNVQEGLLKILDPRAYQLARGSREIEEEIAGMRSQADALVAAGQLPPEILDQIELLRDLRLAELTKEVDEAGNAFAQLRPRLLQWLDAMGVSEYAELSPKAARDEALAQYLRVLGEAQSGDATAAQNLTAYADRLLALDRQATDSAQARLALANQIRADVAGIAAMGLQPQTTETVMADLAKALQQIFLDPETGLLAANDNGEGGLAAKLAIDLGQFRAMYADVITPQTDRQVNALTALQASLEARLNALQSATVAELKSVGEAIAGGQRALDERLAQLAQEAALGALATAELAHATSATQAFLRKRGIAA